MEERAADRPRMTAGSESRAATPLTRQHRLLIVRHAKSAWPDLPDHERPLAKRGRRQAPLVGAWLRSRDYHPDLVLCSTARRARETWQLMAGELGSSPRVTNDGRIYAAAAATLLDLVRRTPQTVRTLLVVGHDPGVADLTRALAGDRASDSGRRAMARVWPKFPTGAVAVLDVSGGWSDLDAGAAGLIDFVVPRDLER